MATRNSRFWVSFFTLLGAILLASLSFSDNGIKTFVSNFGLEAVDVFFVRCFLLASGAASIIISRYLSGDAFDRLVAANALLDRTKVDLSETTAKLEQTQEKLLMTKKALSDHKEASFFALHHMLSKHLRDRAREFFEGEPPTDFRITVYSHRKDADNFSQVGRYSGNPLFNKPGRSNYALDSGSIGAAWQDGECLVENLPDPERTPDEYQHKLTTDWHMSEEQVGSLTMQSRAMKGLRIMGGRSKAVPVGVLLIETTNETVSDRYRSLLSMISADESGALDRVIYHEYELHKKIGSVGTD